MKPLLKTLLERDLIPANCVLTGTVKANVLGGVIHKIRKNVYFKQLNIKGFICIDEMGKKYQMEFDDIEAIDGMPLDRYARVYNIKADGSRAKVGKKRGRKPKPVVNILEA